MSEITADQITAAQHARDDLLRRLPSLNLTVDSVTALELRLDLARFNHGI
jgi:hypothetical protein